MSSGRIALGKERSVEICIVDDLFGLRFVQDVSRKLIRGTEDLREGREIVAHTVQPLSDESCRV